MAGHSHWANIKRKKEASDKKKSIFFTRAAKMIMTAIKEGGPNPDTNINLRIAMQYAKKVNMPNANVERLIKKYGNKNKIAYKEVLYEGLFKGIPLLIRVLTDNSNRSLTEIKQVFNEYGGTLAEKGAVSWQFEQLGKIVIGVDSGVKVDELLLKIMDIVEVVDYLDDKKSNSLVIFVQRDNLKQATDKLERQQYQVLESYLQYKYTGPKIQVASDVTLKLHDLLNALKDLDDVTSVWAGI